MGERCFRFFWKCSRDTRSLEIFTWIVCQVCVSMIMSVGGAQTAFFSCGNETIFPYGKRVFRFFLKMFPWYQKSENISVNTSLDDICCGGVSWWGSKLFFYPYTGRQRMKLNTFELSLRIRNSFVFFNMTTIRIVNGPTTAWPRTHGFLDHFNWNSPKFASNRVLKLFEIGCYDFLHSVF